MTFSGHENTVISTQRRKSYIVFKFQEARLKIFIVLKFFFIIFIFVWFINIYAHKYHVQDSLKIQIATFPYCIQGLAQLLSHPL